MIADDRSILWNQFILARALARALRLVAADCARNGGDAAPPRDADMPAFSYVDTHAGPGRNAGVLPHLPAVLAARPSFASDLLFRALDAAPPDRPGGYPGSWVLAGRVAALIAPTGLDFQMDINDLDEAVLSRARAAQETARVRYWSHDWFLFLRARLGNLTPPDFVFIDPPPDDARGPAYGIDAAILLDTLSIPYLLTYPVAAPQDPIDQIGRTGLELRLGDGGFGAVLGGGAETVVLDILGDLRRLAACLGGTFAARLPREADYSI